MSASVFWKESAACGSCLDSRKLPPDLSFITTQGFCLLGISCLVDCLSWSFTDSESIPSTVFLGLSIWSWLSSERAMPIAGIMPLLASSSSLFPSFHFFRTSSRFSKVWSIEALSYGSRRQPSAENNDLGTTPNSYSPMHIFKSSSGRLFGITTKH